MKLVANMTIAPKDAPEKTINTVKDVGDVAPEMVVNALHMFTSSIVQDLQAHPGATFRALAITSE